MNDEATLIERAKRGDAEALETLAESYVPRVLRFGMKMCRDEHDAQEIAQQTMLSVASKIGDFRADSRFSTWLFAIARSHCIKHRTRGPAAVPTEPIDESSSALAAPPGWAPDEQLAQRQLDAALDQAISQLEPGQREVLMLRDVEGLPAAEVAEVLGLSVEAVKSRLHRARKELRQKLAPWFTPSVPRAPAASCPDVVDLLSRYQEGDITSDVCRTLEEHVDGCSACAARCQALRRVLSACSSAPAPRLPDDLKHIVSAQIRKSLKKQQASS